MSEPKITLPLVMALLVITPEFQVQTMCPPPNAWRRFWYWALLGWEWQKV